MINVTSNQTTQTTRPLAVAAMTILRVSQRAATLLDDGYNFAGDWFETDTTNYLCIRPSNRGGGFFKVVLDIPNNRMSCECEFHRINRIPCKHLICLFANKADIDTAIALERSLANIPDEAIDAQCEAYDAVNG